MASCITPTFGSSSCPQVRLTVAEQSSSATQSVLSWKLEYVAHGYAFYTSVAKSYTVKIAGSTVKSGTYDIDGKTGTTTIASGTKTVNKTTSKQTISFSCSMAFNAYWGSTYGGTKSASGSIAVSAKSSYTITYNANGGSGAPGKQTKWAGTNIKLSSTKPTRTGYSFAGWSTANDSSVEYSAGATYSKDASVTLYAVWKANTYTVSYNANGGSGAPGNQTKTYGVNLTLSSTTPIRDGYNFVGWGTSTSSTTVAYAPGAVYSANSGITLYAIWSVGYVAPRVTNVSVDRCTSNGTLDDDGTYAKVEFNWSTDKEIKSIKIYWGPIGTIGDLPNSVTVTASGTSGSVTQVIGAGALSTEQQYSVAIAVEDEAQTYLEYALPSAQYILDFRAGGKGIAVGKVAETDDLFDVYWPTIFRQALQANQSFVIVGSGGATLTITPEGSNVIRFSYGGSDMVFDGAISIGDTYIGDTITTKGLIVNGAATVNGNTVIGGYLAASNSSNIVGTHRFTTGWMGFYASYSDAYHNINRKGWIGYNGGDIFNIYNDSSDTNIYAGAAVRFRSNIAGKGSTFMDFFREQSGGGRTILRPNTNGGAYIGTTSYRWNTAFFTNAITASDLKEKEVLDDFDMKSKELIMGLTPIAYHRTGEGDTGKRIHYGFGAQTVYKLVNDLEIGDLALVQASIVEDGEERPYYGEDIEDEKLSWGINYNEFIAPMVVTIQRQQKEIDDLKTQVSDLKELVKQLVESK